MKLLQPLRTLTGFLRAFDNGGRLWSIWSNAGDGVITTGEIAKGGASLAAGRTAILHFELLRGLLPTSEGERALASLDKKAKSRWKRHEPMRCSAAEAITKPAGTAVIVEGEPLPAAASAGTGITFTTFIMVGKVMVPVVVPIEKRYRLWQMDGGKASAKSILLSTYPKKLDLSGRRLAIACFVYESTARPGKGQSKGRCLIGVAACPS